MGEIVIDVFIVVCVVWAASLLGWWGFEVFILSPGDWDCFEFGYDYFKYHPAGNKCCNAVFTWDNATNSYIKTEDCVVLRNG